MTANCNYTFDKRNKQKNMYDKIFEYVATHRDFKLSRFELLHESGYIDDRIYNMYMSKYGAPYRSGYCCYVTGKMRELKILTYNNHTKLWSIGKNFDHYYNLNK